MINGNYEDEEKRLEKEKMARERKKRKKMKVTGAAVKQLNKIIKEKNEK